VVSRDDILLGLDPSTAEKQMQQARKDLDALKAAADAARAQATWARQEHGRTERLLAMGAASKAQMDQVQTRLDAAVADVGAAEARIAGAEASIRLAQNELDHLLVRAPFDGVITQRFVEVGESVIPGQPVLEIMSPDSLYVSAPIDEIDIGRLDEGLPARVTLDPYPDQEWMGSVRRVAPYVNDVKEQNRTLEVEVDLFIEASDPHPKPGTSADVEIILDRRNDVLRLPTFAVIEGKRVLVAEKGKAVSREVTIGLRNWEWTEVREGLAEGELVITNLDKQGVKPGARITVLEKEASTPGVAKAGAP
jgi:HlyD family secretion protein